MEKRILQTPFHSFDIRQSREKRHGGRGVVLYKVLKGEDPHPGPTLFYTILTERVPLLYTSNREKTFL